MGQKVFYIASYWWEDCDPTSTVVARDQETCERVVGELIQEDAERAVDGLLYESVDEALDHIFWSGIHAEKEEFIRGSVLTQEEYEELLRDGYVIVSR